MRRVCVVVTARPSYSRMKTALAELARRPDVELQLVVAGSALLDRYGQDVVERSIAELEVRSEQLMRAHIETIPDGTWRAAATVDSDGIVNAPLTICVNVQVDNSDLHRACDQISLCPPIRSPIGSGHFPRISSTS